VLDLEESTLEALRSGLADPSIPPVEATLRILADELGAVTSWFAAQDDPAQACGQVPGRRGGDPPVPGRRGAGMCGVGLKP
jgi:hypothetical protein